MKYNVFSCFDSKAGYYSKPMFCKSKGEAIRSFSDEANNRESYLYLHSEDFVLFELGTFDDVDGKFELLNTPMPIGKACEFRKSSVVSLPSQNGEDIDVKLS